MAATLALIALPRVAALPLASPAGRTLRTTLAGALIPLIPTALLTTRLMILRLARAALGMVGLPRTLLGIGARVVVRGIGGRLV